MIDMIRYRAVLLKSVHSSMTLSFNENNGPQYCTVAEFFERYGDALGEHEWVSPEEFEKAKAENSWWTMQWYPNTPIGSYALNASSVEALIAAVEQFITEEGLG